MSGGEVTGRWRNADLDWDRWPVPTYLAENYRTLHASDDAVIVHHSAFYRGLQPGSVGRSVEIGTGPNLYPLLLASGASRSIDAVDAGAAGLAYLHPAVVHRDLKPQNILLEGGPAGRAKVIS